MATSPRSTALSAAEISALRSSIIRKPPHIFTDPIDMEHILEIDAGLGKQLLAQRLQTTAELHKAMADGAAKAAALLK